MDYNQIALFISVVEAGSISEASRRLNVAKSNLSRGLSALEKRIGVQLVYRNTRNFKPTEAGLDLYQQCKGPFVNIQRATDNIKDNEAALKGRFIITVPVDMAHTILPKVAADFSKNYPQINIEIRGEDRQVDLVKEGVDLALRMGRLNDSNLKSLKIGEVSLILVASPEYLKKYSRIKTPNQLTEQRLILFNKKFEKNLRLAKKNSTASRVKVQSTMIVNNPLIARSIALLSQGIALLPDAICYEELKNGTLQRVLPEYSSEPSPFNYVWPGYAAQSAKVRAFIDFTRERFKQYLVVE